MSWVYEFTCDGCGNVSKGVPFDRDAIKCAHISLGATIVAEICPSCFQMLSANGAAELKRRLRK